MIQLYKLLFWTNTSRSNPKLTRVMSSSSYPTHEQFVTYCNIQLMMSTIYSMPQQETTYDIKPICTCLHLNGVIY